jgi:hypothetical protein
MLEKTFDHKELLALRKTLREPAPLISDPQHAIQWMKKALEVSQGKKCMDQLLATLFAIPAPDLDLDEPQLSLEIILLQVIINDEQRRDEGLGVLWQYLTSTEEPRLESVVNLKANLFPRAVINHPTADPASLLLLHALTSRTHGTKLYYLGEFFKQAESHYTVIHLRAIEQIQALYEKPDEFIFELSKAYGSNKLKLERSFKVESPEERELVQLLGRGRPGFLGMHFSIPFRDAINYLPTCDYRKPLKQRWAEVKTILDAAFENLEGFIDKDQNHELLIHIASALEELHFRSASSDHAAKAHRFADIFFTYFLRELNSRFGDLNPYIEMAMSHNKNRLNPPISSDDIIAAGHVLSYSKSSIQMVSLACTVLKSKPLENVAEAFKTMPEAMAGFYLNTGNKKLLPLMTNEAKRMVISEDLEL